MSEISTEALHTLAALDALDLLDEAERAAFAAQGEDGAALKQRYAATAAALAEAPRPAAPPPGLRGRVFARLPGAAKPAEFSLEEGIWVVRSGQKPWEETGFAGIRRKQLFFDGQRQQASNLINMRAGSVYPKHWHAGLEELYMLSGEVQLSGHTLGPGDYCRADPGTVHDPVIAATDCLFIAFSSSKDQIVSPLSITRWLAGKLARFATGLSVGARASPPAC